jgi:hypothetical protein
MIDVSEIINDPDFAQDFIVTRSSGAFGIGGWIEKPADILELSGPILVASAKELNQVDEADRVQGAMVFYCTCEIFETHNTRQPGTSDLIKWRGDDFRIAKVWQWTDYGYYKAFGVRISGD